MAQVTQLDFNEDSELDNATTTKPELHAQKDKDGAGTNHS